MGTIKFNNHEISPQVKFTKEIKNFLISIFKKEHVLFESLTYVFCTDDYLLNLNQQYLQHDTLTDILTFGLSDPGSPIISEIYISIERVRENASILKIDYPEELFRVMVHGILHLCGYDDHTGRQKKVMCQKEDYYLNLLSST